MLKNKNNNNNLDNRREFYIYRVARNGKMYDDNETERNIPTVKKTANSSNSTFKQEKKTVSYSDSFVYRESTEKYDAFRQKKTEEVIEEKIPSVERIEEPREDKKVGYYDDGLVIEKEEPKKDTLYEDFDGYDSFVKSIDEIYSGNFEENNDSVYQENFEEILDNSFSRENLGKQVGNYPSSKQTYENNTPVQDDRRFEEIGQELSKVDEPKREPIRNEEPRADEMYKTRESLSKPTQESVDRISNVTPQNMQKPSPQTQMPSSQPVIAKRKKTKYIAPGLDLLTKSDAKNADNLDEAENQKQIINNTFEEAGIRAKVDSYIFGPTVTQFLISIEKGANVKDVRKVESNLLMYLQCESIRIQTPIPGKPFAGIEVPKKIENRRTVFFGDMIANKEFKALDYVVPVAVGQDNYGIYHYIDLTEMPHGLIAGTTKSGKSVCLNTFLLSLIYRFTPDELRLVLIDPKRIELGIYEGIPHLAMPVIVEQEDFQSALGWVYDEMERRYKEFELYDEHNIVDYNKIRKENKEETMPHIIVMMDEFSDWFSDANSEIELYMQRLAAKARAAGINIILATQRPSKDVIKGTIKANFDTRIAFRVSSFEDAKVILGYGGAEKLEGKGDMLIRYAGRAEQRLQGAFVPNSDIKKVTRFLKENNTCDYLITKEEIHQSTVSRQASSTSAGRTMGRDDERFEEVAFYVVRNKNASVNQITQIFNMGFNRVNDIFLALEEMGVLSPGVKGKQREVLMDEFELRDLLEQDE